MKKLFNLFIACLLCLCVVGCSSSSGEGAGNKTINPDYDPQYEAFDFFDALIKDEYFVTLGVEGQGDLSISPSIDIEGEVVYENDDFIIKNTDCSVIRNSMTFEICKDDESYAAVDIFIRDYKEGLKNGDEVIIDSNVRSVENGHEFRDLGYDSKYSAMKYKISGLPEVITSVKDIDRNKLIEAIKSSGRFDDYPIISLYFLTLKDGEEPYSFTYYSVPYIEGLHNYSYKEYQAESIIFILFDEDTYWHDKVSGMAEIMLTAVRNPDKSNIYNGNAYLEHFTESREFWDKNWNPAINNGYESPEDYFQKEYPQYDVVEIK